MDGQAYVCALDVSVTPRARRSTFMSRMREQEEAEEEATICMLNVCGTTLPSVMGTAVPG